jgi:CRP-like cAMP-binding protein
MPVATATQQTALHWHSATVSGACPAGAALPVDDSKELARVGPGQCFGELALLSGDGRAANVIALDTSLVRARNAS